MGYNHVNQTCRINFFPLNSDLYMSNSGHLTNVGQAVKLSAADHPGAKVRLTKKGIEYGETNDLYR